MQLQKGPKIVCFESSFDDGYLKIALDFLRLGSHQEFFQIFPLVKDYLENQVFISMMLVR
jgi:hypothetical protein